MNDYLKKRLNEKIFGKPPKEKKVYKIPAKSAKKIAEEKAEKERLGGGDSELVQWFKNRIKQMTGYCTECHARTETKNYQYAIYSVCHILEKRDALFPSVKVHPKNWIELCPDHHTLFDKANWEERELMGCWNVVWERLIQVYPNIAQDELKHLPVELRERIIKLKNV